MSRLNPFAWYTWLRQWIVQHFGPVKKGLGRVPLRRKHPYNLTAYLTAPLPAPPAKWMPFRLLWWGEYGNDRFGDCVFAACAHCWMALARLLKVRFGVTANQVIGAYRLYCERYNGGADNGSDPATVLANWRTDGMWGTKLPASAPIDHTNLTEVRQVLASYGCLAVEVQLPKPAYSYQMGGNFLRFKRPVWKLTGTPDDDVIVGGHEVAAIGYDANYVYVVSWGVVVRVTASWWAKYVVGAEALVVPAVAAANGFNGLNITALIADLQALPA